MNREWSTSPGDGHSSDLRPPQNIEAERSALGCALLSEDALEILLARLEDKDFYDPKHRVIVQGMRNLVLKKKAVDVLTLAEELDRNGKLEEIGGRFYIMSLPDAAPILSNAPHYISIVREKSLLRSVIMVLDEVKSEAYQSDEAAAILDLAAAKLFDLKADDGTGGPQALQKVVAQVVNEIHSIQRGDDDGLRIKTGYPSLDKLLGGLKPGTLNIIAARPAMGKSALAINIAQKVSVRQKLPTAVFSLEMSQSEIGVRVMSSEMLIDSYELSSGSFDPELWENITRAIIPLYTAPMYVHDRAGASPLSILSECRRLKMEHGLSLVVIDYLQLMRPDGRHESRVQEISEISRNLKLLAKDLNVPVIALSQLNRSTESRHNRRPLLSDLRESGSIEQDADTVWFIYRDSYYSEEPEGAREPAEIIVAKNRGGATGTVILSWIPKYTLFIDESFRDPPPEYGSGPLPDPPFDPTVPPEDSAAPHPPFDMADEDPAETYPPPDDSDFLVDDESDLPYE